MVAQRKKVMKKFKILFREETNLNSLNKFFYIFYKNISLHIEIASTLLTIITMARITPIYRPFTSHPFRNLATSSSISSTKAKTSKTDTTPLKLSNELYAIFKIHNRPYLVTEGDRVILPFKLKQAEVGDILNMTDVTTLGSRNYKLVGHPINTSLYTLKQPLLGKLKGFPN
ncbi:CRE_collapsed_G0028610.mRNA.1.CDS.1 [Saccharomyces cerevisiae]|nr:CRE_collapsed_G0028610.mRNA.1.CDS.1 [Saccharomyces cerevisiae]